MTRTSTSTHQLPPAPLMPLDRLPLFAYRSPTHTWAPCEARTPNENTTPIAPMTAPITVASRRLDGPPPAGPVRSLRLLREDVYAQILRRRRRAQIAARHVVERE